MICLDNTDVIEGGASVDAVIDYQIHGLAGTTFAQLAAGVMGTTLTTVLYAAGAAISIVSIILVNKHSSAVEVTLSLDPADGGNPRYLIPKTISLGAGYSLHTDGAKITVMDASGRLLEGYGAHASDHTDGTDDIQDATDAQKGVATAVQITKLDGIEEGATAGGGDTDIIEMNILLLAFKIAVADSLTKFNMVDGVSDAFVDESGVDAGASINEDYDSGGDFYSPATIISWSDVLDTGDGTGWADRTIRTVLPAGSINNSGNKIRVTLEAGSGEGCDIDNVSIVERDPGTANGLSTPTEILFSAGSGVNIGSGQEEVSDWLTFAFDETKDYLLIIDMASNAAADAHRYVFTGGGGIYRKDATNSYNAQNLIDSTFEENATRVVNKLEVMSDMTLVSESTEAEANPDTVRIVLMEEDVDAITENTDLKAYASRDNGGNWVQATLADEGDYGSGKRILEGKADVSGQAEDKTVKWKVTTHNGKDLKLHGLGLLWK